MAENIVPNDMREARAEQVEFFKCGSRVTFPMNDSPSFTFRHGGKGEYPGFFGIDFQINRQTARQDFGMVPRCLNTDITRRVSL
ncbi:hypothetical protein SAMN04487859_1478 [Roseovarius lutimaris]|uniref:Uncharacterized protein n=1 Tax=Roseovarius lutimaris TaxID=1005928 RepID=A0A1I5H0L9_9RHOB|nr:hypothetical protein SAMN04487859_1478 [Roseovarius lutimaris]